MIKKLGHVAGTYSRDGVLQSTHLTKILSSKFW